MGTTSPPAFTHVYKCQLLPIWRDSDLIELFVWFKIDWCRCPTRYTNTIDAIPHLFNITGEIDCFTVTCPVLRVARFILESKLLRCATCQIKDVKITGTITSGPKQQTLSIGTEARLVMTCWMGRQTFGNPTFD
jgi:hypothetical protein